MKKCFFLLVLGFIPVSGQAECSFKLKNGTLLVFTSGNPCEISETDAQGKQKVASPSDQAACDKSIKGKQLGTVDALCKTVWGNWDTYCTSNAPDKCPVTACQCKNLGLSPPPGAVPSPPGPPSGEPNPPAGPTPGGSSGGALWPKQQKMGEDTIRHLQGKILSWKEKISDLEHHKMWEKLAHKRCILNKTVHALPEGPQNLSFVKALNELKGVIAELRTVLNNLQELRQSHAPKPEDYPNQDSFIRALNNYAGKLEREYHKLNKQANQAFSKLNAMMLVIENKLKKAGYKLVEEGCKPI